jgi:hypothetical protein
MNVLKESKMLTIEYIDVIEKIKIGDLFDQIGFNSTTLATDDSGDSFIKNEWGIETLSLDGYYSVEGFRWTKPEKQIRVYHHSTTGTILEDTIPYLQCSPDHIVMRVSDDQNVGGWVKVKELSIGAFILSIEHEKIVKRKICGFEAVDNVERLCDMQVSISHSYFTGGVLSHNSHFLTFLGANALRAGVDVLHYTLELSEAAVGRRYDSNLCDINSNDIIDNKNSVLEKYKSMKLGRLMIKEFPTNTASIYTIRSHIERLDLKGFRPGLIIIDYADILRSTRQYDSLRHELKLIYEELRGFATEKSLPIWTASQSNKEGSTSDIVDLNNMSEAYGKAMIADVILSISRRSHEKASGSGRLYVAKNRAGRDGIVYPVKIDTAKSGFEIVGREGDLQEASVDDEKALKRALTSKWRELKNDPDLQKTSTVDTIAERNILSE